MAGVELPGSGTTRNGATAGGEEGGMGGMWRGLTEASWPEQVLKGRGRPPTPVGYSLAASVSRTKLVKGSHGGLESQCPRSTVALGTPTRG